MDLNLEVNQSKFKNQNLETMDNQEELLLVDEEETEAEIEIEVEEMMTEEEEEETIEESLAEQLLNHLNLPK
jgi:hypothetical protein